MVKLTPFAKRKPHQLSGGQRQRVALARSLAKRPKVLLLDEPLGALDKKLREETQFELTDLQVDLGLTFIIVTHDQEEAMTLADRIAVMDHGRIVQIGTPGRNLRAAEQPLRRRLHRQHQSDRRRGGREAAAARSGSTAPTPRRSSCGRRSTAAPKQPAWFAIRPEKIDVSLTEPADARSTPRAARSSTSATSAISRSTTSALPSGAMVKATIANRTRMVERPITWHDKVWLTWNADAGIVLTS